VLNNTKVLKARIKGRRKTGGAVEILLVRPLRDNVWECLLKPLRKIKIGEVLLLNGGAEVNLLERTERTAIIELGMSAQELDSYLDDWGEVPDSSLYKKKSASRRISNSVCLETWCCCSSYCRSAFH